MSNLLVASFEYYYWTSIGNVISRPVAETLYEGYYALSTKPVMLFSALHFSATRWSCSQQSLLSAGLQLHLFIVVGIKVDER